MTLEAFAMLLDPTGPIRIVERNENTLEYEILFEFTYCSFGDLLEKVRNYDLEDRIVDSIWTDWDTEEMDVPACLAIKLRSI